MIFSKPLSKLQVLLLIILVILFLTVIAIIPGSINTRNSSHPSNEMNANIDTLSAEAETPKIQHISLNTNEDIEYLSSVVNQIFPNGYEYITDEEKAITIEKFLVNKLKLKDNSGNATKILQDGYAICGGFSEVFSTLTIQSGIPSRKVGIFGLTGQLSHSLNEVYYHDTWHLFDPTFGTFFYSEPNYNLKGYIPSLQELLGNKSKDFYLFTVSKQPWTGNINKSDQVTRMDNNFGEDIYGPGFKQIYIDLFKQAFPTKYNNQQILSFPVIANLKKDFNFSVGEIDDDYSDFIHASTLDNHAGKVGWHWIGGNNPESVHTWFIKTPSDGVYSIIYYCTVELSPNLLVFPLKSVQAVITKKEGKRNEFIVTTNSNESSLQIWAENNTFMVDAIRAEWLGYDSPNLF